MPSAAAACHGNPIQAALPCPAALAEALRVAAAGGVAASPVAGVATDAAAACAAAAAAASGPPLPPLLPVAAVLLLPVLPLLPPLPATAAALAVPGLAVEAAGTTLSGDNHAILRSRAPPPPPRLGLGTALAAVAAAAAAAASPAALCTSTSTCGTLPCCCREVASSNACWKAGVRLARALSSDASKGARLRCDSTHAKSPDPSSRTGTAPRLGGSASAGTNGSSAASCRAGHQGMRLLLAHTSWPGSSTKGRRAGSG